MLGFGFVSLEGCLSPALLLRGGGVCSCVNVRLGVLGIIIGCRLVSNHLYVCEITCEVFCFVGCLGSFKTESKNGNVHKKLCSQRPLCVYFMLLLL